MKNEINNIVPNQVQEDIVIYDESNIKNLIYTIRGRQVMLDNDVAMLYHYETKKINQTVKRNAKRFPEEFCFQLTEEEYMVLRSQIVTLNELKRGQHKKYLPYVFTEQGIAMISGLLKNEIAVQVSINIINTFVEMRKFFLNNGEILNRLTNVEYKLLKYDERFNQIFNELQKDEKEEFKQKIFFDGQVYDAYSLIIDIIKKANQKILLIDNYIDETILKLLTRKQKDVEVVILTSYSCPITKLDLRKFNEQYPTLKIGRTTKFHDRFILIDQQELYHCGASFKDLGKKCFAVSKIEDDEYKEQLIKKI